METQPDLIETFMQAGCTFCHEFVRHPYLCYTEHGWHAYFFTLLYNSLPPASRYAEHKGHKICIVQKEYPTAESLGRSRRQHWDVALIDTPLRSIQNRVDSYDHLYLAAVAEFGLNARISHLANDIDRLCDVDSNVQGKFLFHFLRLSDARSRVSRRDISPASRKLMPIERLAELVANTTACLFVAVADQTANHENGAWFIKNGKIAQLALNDCKTPPVTSSCAKDRSNG